jgi:hypothetical protein
VAVASVSCHYASLTPPVDKSTRDLHGQPIAAGDYGKRSVRLADRAVIFMPFLRRFSPFPPHSPFHAAIFAPRPSGRAQLFILAPASSKLAPAHPPPIVIEPPVDGRVAFEFLLKICPYARGERRKLLGSRNEKKSKSFSGSYRPHRARLKLNAER